MTNPNNPFRFDLGDTVEIACSGERGTVEGRAEYTPPLQRYYVRYKKADGTAAEYWWDDEALRLPN